MLMVQGLIARKSINKQMYTKKLWFYWSGMHLEYEVDLFMKEGKQIQVFDERICVWP